MNKILNKIDDTYINGFAFLVVVCYHYIGAMGYYKSLVKQNKQMSSSVVVQGFSSRGIFLALQPMGIFSIEQCRTHD